MQRALGFCLVLQGPTNHMDEILLGPNISTQRITTPGIQEKRNTALFRLLGRASENFPAWSLPAPSGVISPVSAIPPAICCNALGEDYLLFGY